MEEHKDKYATTSIYKVETNWRKHPLSYTEGGVTVYVKYSGGFIKEYPNVKYPKRYMDSIDDPKVIDMWMENK